MNRPLVLLVVLVIALTASTSIARAEPVKEPSGLKHEITNTITGYGETWWRQKAIEFEEQASRPFLYILPMMFKQTPNLNRGVVQVVYQAFQTIALGIAGLLFGVGWLQVTGGSFISSPLSPKELISRFCLSVIVILTSARLLEWIVDLSDAIVVKLAVAINDETFAPALDRYEELNIFLLTVAIGVRVFSLWGIWGMLIYRVLDLALLLALSPLPAAFLTLPGTAGQYRAYITEFCGVAFQTVMFTVIIGFWSAVVMWGAEGVELTFFQNLVAIGMLWGYLKHKPAWARGLLHMGSVHYAGQLVATARQAVSRI